MVKVGKSNNRSRTSSLARMGYAGRSDWKHVATFPVRSNHDALALEALIIAKLSNQGYRVPRMAWINLINEKLSYADDCFTCSIEHAIKVAHEMADVFCNHVAEN